MNDIVLCNCDEGMASLPEASVDVVLTDPPYIEAVWEECYGILARGAPRILKPSGFLITYCPQYRLNKIFKMLDESGLLYYWLFVQLNNGPRSRIWARRLGAAFKPVLVYQKPPIKPQERIVDDVIKGGKMEKDLHEWQQSLKESVYLLQGFGTTGCTVVDPFAGSGTSLLAAKLLEMNYMGFEIDPKTHKIACDRLSQSSIEKWW